MVRSLPRYSKTTWCVIVVVAMVLLSFSWVGFKSRLIKHKIAEAQALGLHFPVEVETPKRSNMTAAVQLVGNLLANEAVVLKPEIAGKVVSLVFQEGQPVQKGTPLLKLDAAIYAAQAAQAEASLKLSTQHYDRIKKLSAQNAISQSSVDEAAAKLANDRANVALSKANLAKCTIEAPFAGRVGVRDVTVGDYVQPGQALATIVADNPMKVEFHVPENVSAQVAMGQEIKLTIDAFPAQTFEGEVYAIDSVMDPEGRSILVRAKVPNPTGNLRAGLFAHVRLILGERTQALLLPEVALIPSADKFYVYVVNAENKIERKSVEVGLREKGEAEILNGLTEHDKVVQSGQFKLYEGAIVEVLDKQQH